MALYENNIRLKGFVGKNAETRSTATGNTITVFSLATNSSYKDKQSGEWVSRTDWHRIATFGRFSDSAKELKQGDYVEVEGELRSSVYESEIDSNQPGLKRRSWEIRATQIRKLKRPASTGEYLSPENDAA